MVLVGRLAWSDRFFFSRRLVEQHAAGYRFVSSVVCAYWRSVTGGLRYLYCGLFFSFLVFLFPLMPSSHDRKEQKWIDVQVKGLSAWANSYLGRSKDPNVKKIENLSEDLKNGVRLVQLGELLAAKKLKYDLTPKMKIQAIQNLNLGLQVIQADLRVKLTGIGAEDIYAGNLKLILGLLFSTFRALRDSLLANELGEGAAKGSEAQQLIAWVQRQVAPAPYELKVGDWSDFRDGKAFSALLNIYDDKFLDWKSVGSSGVENLTRAFKGFEEHLQIPQLVDPVEVANGTADERSLTLYTSLIYHAHATNAERLRLQREARERELELERQRRALEAQSKDLGGELERLRGDNQRLLERALAAEELARKAFSALDVLKKNLLEHLDDLEHWRELSEIDVDASKLTLYDENKINANLRGRSFEAQVQYLSDNLQAENRTITRILRVKDSKRDVEDTVFKQQTLFMKTEKNGPWAQAYFKLYSEDLAYFASEKDSAERKGALSLKEPETSVILLKPEQADGEQVFPIKMKLASGQQFYVATLSKKDRKDWAAILNGRITHYNYLTATETEQVRPDPRVENLCNAPADCPSVYLDNGELADTALRAVADVLPFLENVNVVSFANTDLADEDVALLGEGLSKASVHVLKLNNNSLKDHGAKTLSTLLAAARCLDELDVSGNQIGDEGATALATLFSAKNPLKRLNIEANKVSDKGITALATALRNVSLPALKFAKNDIGDAGVAAIASLIKSNSTILHVDLANNSITDAGLQVLCEVLKSNTSVLTLNVSRNNLTLAGVTAIHGLLSVNKVLRTVDISDNNIAESPALAGVLTDPSVSISSFAFSRY